MKNNKIFITLVSVLFTVCGLVSCGSNDHQHNYIEVQDKAASCLEDGVIKHYKCSECKKVFDMNKNESVESVFIIPATGHNKTHHNASEGIDCLHEGTIEYWSCSKCNKNFSDEACTQVITDFSNHTKGAHFKTYHPATFGIDCLHEGTIEYWSCSTCQQNYSDEACTRVVTDFSNHTKGPHYKTYHPAVPGTDCLHDGTIEYWSCSICKKYYLDEACTQDVSEESLHVKGPHSMSKHDALAPTCEVDGNIEYWSCGTCSKLFLDVEGKVETSLNDVTLNKLGHSMSSTWSSNDIKHFHECTREGCEHVEDEENHTFGEWIIDKYPTPTEPGSKHRNCNVCEYREDEVIEPMVVATSVIEAINNIPETQDYKGVYYGHVDPFTKRAETLYNSFISSGGSSSDVTNLNKLLSTKDSLSMYDISEDNIIDANIFSKSGFTNEPIKDYVNSGYKFVTHSAISEYNALCSFDKSKAATLKEQLSEASTISFALKVSQNIKVQPQISYLKEDGKTTGYKTPSGVGVTQAGEWLLLTLDSSWIELIVSDSFKLFYITTITGQTTVEAGFEIVIADMYIDKTVAPSPSFSSGWTKSDNQTLFAADTDGTNGYDSTLFTYTQSSSGVVLPFYDITSSTIDIKAKSDITSQTTVYIRPGNVKDKQIRFAFYVSGEMKVSKIEHVKGNNASTSAKDTLLETSTTYTTGWHYVDTIGSSTQYYGYFIFSIDAMTQDSSLLIGRYASLVKTV